MNTPLYSPAATVEECQQRIANTLAEHGKSLDPALLENIIVGINQQVARAYYLGGRDMLAEQGK